jgi:hypothetical protein
MAAVNAAHILEIFPWRPYLVTRLNNLAIDGADFPSRCTAFFERALAIAAE